MAEPKVFRCKGCGEEMTRAEAVDHRCSWPPKRDTDKAGAGT